jgi:hypothetical protein
MLVGQAELTSAIMKIRFGFFFAAGGAAVAENRQVRAIAAADIIVSRWRATREGGDTTRRRKCQG